ncbi:unnamed protein product [Brassica napus]|uniref:(rape) hypothetical protein n=1 Tax=Brassica napus TaxID=3708 RepID=A0A816RX30_BRANA|nr:unnamed protein product [Brassica napus]
MSLKLVDYERGDVKKYHYAIRDQCRFHPDSGEREFRSVLGPTGNKLQRKLPEMKLKKKKKKHMKSNYEKTKKLSTPASPTTTLKQRKTQKRKKLFVAQARSQGITMSRTLPDFSVVSNVFKKKQDSEQSTDELALEKVRLFVSSLFYNYLFVKEENTIHVAARHSPYDDITVDQGWMTSLFPLQFLLADHPLGSHLRATLQRDGERHGSVHVLSSLHLIQRSTITIKLSILQLVN